MYAEVLPNLAGSWPHSDFTLLSHSVTCTFLALPFFKSEMFLEYVGYHICFETAQATKIHVCTLWV